MKYPLLILLTLFSASILAGPDEYTRDLAIAKADLAYRTKLCYKLPEKRAQDCLHEVNRTYADALRGLKEWHLNREHQYLNATRK